MTYRCRFYRRVLSPAQYRFLYNGVLDEILFRVFGHKFQYLERSGEPEGTLQHYRDRSLRLYLGDIDWVMGNKNTGYINIGGLACYPNFSVARRYMLELFRNTITEHSWIHFNDGMVIYRNLRKEIREALRESVA